MNRQKSRITTSAPALLVAAALLLGNPCFADNPRFRVSFERVPGAAEIEAGNLQAGIKVLEYQLAKTELDRSGDILATLCAAYIVNDSLDEAEGVCDKAVEISPTEAAYNNRGVFRAVTGNLSGARADFERVRPPELEAYLEELKTTDIPLVANENFYLADELLSKRSSEVPGRSYTSSGATIENVIN